MYLALAISFLMFFIPAFGLVALIGWLTRRVPRKVQTPLLVIASCMLLTPTLGPATIAVVPVTFGWLLIPTVLTGSWPDLASWISEYPRWHAFAFPITALAAYLAIRRVRGSLPW
jgi:hypothetical protein